MVCKICGKPLPLKKGRGGRLYCEDACRNVAYIERREETLENRLSNHCGPRRAADSRQPSHGFLAGLAMTVRGMLDAFLHHEVRLAEDVGEGECQLKSRLIAGRRECSKKLPECGDAFVIKQDELAVLS
jgi:hypothetical protein